MSLTGIVSDVTLAMIILVVLLLIVVTILLTRKLDSSKTDPNKISEAVKTSMSQNTDWVKDALKSTLSSSQDTLKGSVALAMKELKVDEAIGNIGRVTDEMATSTSTLLRVLEVGQKRGSFGETRLEQLLKDTMPSGYIHMREKINGVGTPDAHLESPFGIVCIDSKFPIDNYRRYVETSDVNERKKFKNAFSKDVKDHISKVSEYVQPNKGTAKIAYAFIPSESVYAFMAEELNELIEESSKEDVIVSSPSTLIANLTLISAANRAMEITKEAEVIQNKINGLSSVIDNFESEWSTLFSHINNAYRKSTTVESAFNNLKSEFEEASHPTPGSSISDSD